MTNKDLTFTELLKKHVKDMTDARYKSIECLIAHVMLTTGAKVWELELVEKRHDTETSWYVRKKSDVFSLSSSGGRRSQAAKEYASKHYLFGNGSEVVAMNKDIEQAFTAGEASRDKAIIEECKRYCQDTTIRPDNSVTKRGMLCASLLWKHLENWIDTQPEKPNG